MRLGNDSLDSLGSGSLRDLGAQVNHLDLQDLRDIGQLSHRDGGPEQFEVDDNRYVLQLKLHYIKKTVAPQSAPDRNAYRLYLSRSLYLDNEPCVCVLEETYVQA